MREAAEWLRTTAMTASEISYKLGYCNPNHFSRQFKEYHGASPASTGAGMRNPEREATVSGREPTRFPAVPFRPGLNGRAGSRR